MESNELKSGLEKTKPKFNPFLEYIRDRIRHNKNCIIVIVGATGSGKSYAALRLAEELDPDFTTDNVTFDAVGFLRLTGQPHRPGTVIMFDEGGVDLGSREFMSKKNRGLSKILQTVRYKNHIIIVTVPDISFLDAHARKLTHLILKMNLIIDTKGLSRATAYAISPQPLNSKGDIRIPHPVVNIPEVGKVKIRYVYFKKPSVKLQHAYEKIKSKFGDELNERTLNEFMNTEGFKNLSDNEKTIMAATKMGVPDQIISETMGLQISTIGKVRTYMRKKGIPVSRGTKKLIFKKRVPSG